MALPESVSQSLAALQIDQMSERELRKLLAALVDGIQAIATKLDADAGVTATDFAATFANFVRD
jgi:DNA-binding GntR family transcriptional regulator